MVFVLAESQTDHEMSPNGDRKHLFVPLHKLGTNSFTILLLLLPAFFGQDILRLLSLFKADISCLLESEKHF
jgi:hypothetical protein